MTARPGGLAVAVLLCIAGAAAAAPPATGDADVATRLAALAGQREVRLTTIGRRSGKPHTVPVWFVVDGARVFLNTLDTTRDWVRNAQRNPAVRLDFGSLVLAGTLRTVADDGDAARARELLRAKYWAAWLGGLVGKGPKAVFVVEHLRPAAP